MHPLLTIAVVLMILLQVTGFQRLSNMCEVDIDIFCDGDRMHMKEGIVLVVRYNEYHVFALALSIIPKIT